MSTTEVLFEILNGTHGGIGLITLNRPEQLNALTQAMCCAIDDQLVAWAETDAVKAVVIRGAGERAFCAGGDIRALYQSRDSDHAIGREFFQHEYRMNWRIQHFPKPYIALLDGLTMGGGMGVSVNGRYRVGTEKLKLAMPETGIGFFPDVGGGYFLSRCRGKIGWYLGLVGGVIQVADAHYAGLVTSMTPSADIPALLAALVDADWSQAPHATAQRVLAAWAVTPPLAPLAAHQAVIDACFSQPNVAAIMAYLAQQTDEWSQQTLALLQSRCPISLSVALEQINRGKVLSFADEMRMEFRIANRFLQTPDFYEGIRAAVIDKDRSPRWQSRLGEVTVEEVGGYFAPLERELVLGKEGVNV